MTRQEIAAECRRVKAAINKTKSEKLKRDYTKHLRKMQAQLLKNEG